MRSGSRVFARQSLLSSHFSTLILAQTATTSLRGTITDPKGAVLPGAVVTIVTCETAIRARSKPMVTGVSDSQLPPSTYTVAVNSAGFAEVKQEGVRLAVSVPPL